LVDVPVVPLEGADEDAPEPLVVAPGAAELVPVAPLLGVLADPVLPVAGTEVPLATAVPLAVVLGVAAEVTPGVEVMSGVAALPAGTTVPAAPPVIPGVAVAVVCPATPVAPAAAVVVPTTAERHYLSAST
jgi:hypothetical protein